MINHCPTEQIDTPGGRAAVSFNRFIKENEYYFIKTNPCAKVALMWSDLSANFYSSTVSETDFIKEMEFGIKSEIKGDHYKSFMGFYDILTRGHIQFDLIDEASIIKGNIKKYDVLILPTCACLSEEIADLLKTYISQGGKLISSFDTGLYDEFGYMRKNSVISDIQGILEFKEIVVYKEGCGYQKIIKNSFISDKLSYKYIPAPLLSVKAKPKDGVAVLAENTYPMESRYIAMPEKTFPSVYYNKYGNGESTYFSGALGEFYNEYSNVDYKRMVLNAVNKFSLPVVASDAPETVEMVLRKKDNMYILHLINLTGEMTRPIENIIPIYNINIKVNIEMKVKSVKTLKENQNISIKNQNSGCELVLPCLKNCEIIIITFE